MSLRLTWITLATLTCCSVMLGCAPIKTRSGSKALPTGGASGRAAGTEQLDGLLQDSPPTRTAQKSAKPSLFGGDNTKKEAAKQSEIESELALARLGERRGQSDGAKQLYRKIIEKYPEHPAAYHRLAVLHGRDSNFEEADRYFQRALQMGEPSIDLLSDYGYCLYLQSRYDDAERVLRQALRKKPNHEATCNNLGLVLGAQGRYSESLEAFQRVNSEAEAHANLAYVFSQNGDLENARKGYLQALTLDKQLKSAAVAVIQVEKRLQLQERERARIAQQKAAETAAANAQPAAPPAQGPASAAPATPAVEAEKPQVVQAPAPVVETPIRQAKPEVAARQPAKSPAPAAVEEEEIVELPPVRIATRPPTVERSEPQPVVAAPKPVATSPKPVAAAPVTEQDPAPIVEAPRATVKAPSLAQPTLPRAKIVPAKPAPVEPEATETARELEKPQTNPALTASSPAPAKETPKTEPVKVEAPKVVAQPAAPETKPATIPAAEPIAKPAAPVAAAPVAKPSPLNTDFEPIANEHRV
jgi:Tfp pilus assembly protein PilF